ncbi:hypothetical protein HK102_005425 [Quaeritorhiza haematococci]|nr:hypothetical protein HK102_005425 [Quaeritorhiza haematococci]
MLLVRIDDRKTLFVCCRVNRTWYGLARPFLWRELCWDVNKPGPTFASASALIFHDLRKSGSAVGVSKLPLSFDSQPDPASFVVKLEFHPSKFSDRLTRFLPRFTSLKDLTIHVKRFTKAGEILSSLAPSKTSIKLRVVAEQSRKGKFVRKDTNSNATPFYSRCSHIRWVCRDSSDPISKSQWLEIVNSAHPSLRAVELPLDMPPGLMRQFLRQCSSELKAVQLLLSPKNAALETLLALGECCRHLRALKVYIDTEIGLDTPDRDFGKQALPKFFSMVGSQLEFLSFTPTMREDVLDAIAQHCTSLKHVVFDHGGDWYDDQTGRYDRSYNTFLATIGSQLESIRVTLRKRDVERVQFLELVTKHCINLERLAFSVTMPGDSEDDGGDSDTWDHDYFKEAPVMNPKMLRNLFNACPALEVVEVSSAFEDRGAWDPGSGKGGKQDQKLYGGVSGAVWMSMMNLSTDLSLLYDELNIL